MHIQLPEWMIVSTIGKSQYITKLDLLKGYWAVLLTERDKEISAFVTPDGAYQYRVMPFGMWNSQATFVRLMNKYISNTSGVDAYIDDDTEEEHLEMIRKVMQWLREARLTVNLDKSEFCSAKVNYLGHVIGHGKIKRIEAKMAAIAEYPRPTNSRRLRRFLGMANYYSRYCKNLAEIATPPTNLLRKGQKFTWTQKCETVLETIKSILKSNPVLRAPDFNKSFQMHTDASDIGIDAVLIQEDENGKSHPVSYYLKKLSFRNCIRPLRRKH